MKSSDILHHAIENLSSYDSGDMSESGSRSFKLMVGRDCSFESEDVRLINEFLKQCASVLELDGDYRCYLSSDRKKSKIKTTAICAFSHNNIRIYCKDRSLADILRSIAHESFHLKQHEAHAVPRKMPPHHLNPIEFDANIFGGSMLSLFAAKKGRDKIYR